MQFCVCLFTYLLTCGTIRWAFSSCKQIIWCACLFTDSKCSVGRVQLVRARGHPWPRSTYIYIYIYIYTCAYRLQQCVTHGQSLKLWVALKGAKRTKRFADPHRVSIASDLSHANTAVNSTCIGHCRLDSTRLNLRPVLLIVDTQTKAQRVRLPRVSLNRRSKQIPFVLANILSLLVGLLVGRQAAPRAALTTDDDDGGRSRWSEDSTRGSRSTRERGEQSDRERERGKCAGWHHDTNNNYHYYFSLACGGDQD